RLRDEVSAMESNVRDGLADANRLARGRFVHALQPELFATPLATDYRRMLAENYRLVPPGLEKAFSVGYPALRRTVAGAGVRSVDLSDLLAADRVPDEVFLDFCHVNHVANAIVAAALFRATAPLLGDCDLTR